VGVTWQRSQAEAMTGSEDPKGWLVKKKKAIMCDLGNTIASLLPELFLIASAARSICAVETSE